MKRILLLCFAVLTGSVAAEVRTAVVPYRDGDQELEGYVAWDDAVKGVRPAVLVVHDWTGLQDYAKQRARMLAELGYVAFAADIYGKDIRPVDPKECAVCSGKYRKDLPLLRRRVQAALGQLKAQPQADAGKVGAIGYCFGGSCVLELARSGSDVRGVVSFHGGLSTTMPAEAGAVRARLLVCHGGADEKVNAEIPAFLEEMKKAGAKMEFVTYDGALHGFTKPGPAYQEKADLESWAAMKKFFGEVFAAKP